MRTRWPLALLAFAALLSRPLATPSVADQPTSQVAAIEATAPLEDPSEGAVKNAIATAVQTAARGALAMGLPWLRIQAAYVREGYVGVQVFAMAKPPDEGSAESGEQRGEGPQDQPKNDDPKEGDSKTDKAPEYRL